MSLENNQQIVLESTKSQKYLSQASGIQFGLSELREECVFKVTSLGTDVYKFENKVTKQPLTDSQRNIEWKIEKDGESDAYQLVGKDGNHYSMNAQGDFIGFFAKKQPGFKILQDFKLPDVNVETPQLNLKEGDKIEFRNYWGQYFGYNYGNPCVYSESCEESIFIVEQSSLSEDFFKFRSPYGQVRMCGQNTSDINFKIVPSQITGYYHLETIGKILLGTTPQGQVMLWEDDKFLTVFWKITKKE